MFYTSGFAALVAASVWLVAVPAVSHAQSPMSVLVLSGAYPLLDHGADPGYLGVEIVDVDADKAQTLKLKEPRGALITLIDHDAPAGDIGLRVNDVILGLNGQPVAGALDLRKMIHDMPPGAKISLLVSRDGNQQTLAATLADRKAMEQAVWGKIGPGADSGTQPAVQSFLGSSGDAPVKGSIHMDLFTRSLKVGAMVEPLTSQMADYLGVKNGLMVKQVDRKSEAETAGLRAFDVILKVGSDAIVTSADWDRALRANTGKPVEITILRDKQQQTLTLHLESKHRGAVTRQAPFGSDSGALVAELN